MLLNNIILMSYIIIDMRTTFLTIRAVGAEYANRLYTPLIVITMLIILLIIALGVWLTTLDKLWWLIFIPITIVASVVVAISIIMKLIINYVRPILTSQQQAQVKKFVSSLEEISEIVQTPRLLIFFKIIRDIVAPSKSEFIKSISVSTKSLKDDFISIEQSFRNK